MLLKSVCKSVDGADTHRVSPCSSEQGLGHSGEVQHAAVSPESRTRAAIGRILEGRWMKCSSKKAGANSLII